MAKEVKREAPSKDLNKKIQDLREQNYLLYLFVRYRWVWLILALLLIWPSLWMIPFVFAIVGLIKYHLMKKEK